MATKKPFVLRIDEDVLKSIEKWAADEFRSTNGQIEWMLTQTLKKEKRIKQTKNTEQISNNPEV